jgi:hypothetical protein
MKVHSDEKINKIKELRRLGFSIGKIVETLSVPKTTIWHHIKGIEISPGLIKTIRSNQGGSAIRSKKEWEESEIRAREILDGPHSRLAISAAMLYWGEGGKKACDIINTDPKLIQLYLKFLYDVLAIGQDQIKFAMRTFTGMDQQECLKYWSAELGVDATKFIIRYNDGGVSGKAKYGMCRITLKKGRKTLKLMHSLIRLAFSDIMGFKQPVDKWIEHRKPIDIRPHNN